MESKLIDTKKSAREIILKAYQDLVELRDNPLRSDRPHMDEESMTNNIFLNTTINFLSEKNIEVRTRIWKEEESKNKEVA
jgi:regulator of sigma D